MFGVGVMFSFRLLILCSKTQRKTKLLKQQQKIFLNEHVSKTKTLESLFRSTETMHFDSGNFPLTAFNLI